MTPKKVLLVANTDWYLYRFRLRLAQYLSENGFWVKLVSPPGLYVSRLTEMGFEWLEWKIDRQRIYPFSEIRSLIRLKEIYRSENPEIVHHHTIKPVLYGSYVARKTGVKATINSITGSGYVFMSRDFKARILKPFVRVFYKIAFNSKNCAVIFENPDDQADFIRQGLLKPDQTWLVRSVGVDITDFTPRPEPSGEPVVTMASRMLWDKGVGVFVEAARLLKERLAVRMVLVGMPDPGNPASVSFEQLETWASEGIVEWLGWQEDMALVYANSNIIVLPSFFEGLPVTLIEAAACGRALIASDIPGCREVVNPGVNGLLTVPGDPVSLADAVEKMILNPDLRKAMGIASRERAVNEFSTEVVNRQTLEIYLKVLEK